MENNVPIITPSHLGRISLLLKHGGYFLLHLNQGDIITILSWAHTSSIHQLRVLPWGYSCSCRVPFSHYIILGLWPLNILWNQFLSHFIFHDKVSQFLTTSHHITLRLFWILPTTLLSNGSSVTFKEPNFLTTTSTCLLFFIIEFHVIFFKSSYQCSNISYSLMLFIKNIIYTIHAFHDQTKQQ